MSIQDRSLSLSGGRKPVVYFTWFLRKQLLQELGNLKHGRITLTDDWGSVTVGDEAHRNHYYIEIKHPAFYTEVAIGGSNGAAAAWRAGYWYCDDLTGLFSLFLQNIEQLDAMESGLARLGMWWFRRRHASRANTRDGSRRNIGDHYDLGNKFFACFLDDTMTYSAGIFARDRDSLKQASINKLDHICQKLRLDVKDHVLEIGSGWGSFAIHAAKYYGCRITTTTISREQYDLAYERIRAEELTDQVEVLLTDYRELEGQYDKLVSIEMIEAVGHEYLPHYFRHCADLLKPEGQMLLQAITMPDDRYDQYLQQTDFIQQFIFPGSCVPSFKAIVDASVLRTDFKISHVEDIGPHYATTLRHWLTNLHDRYDEIRSLGYSDEFLRLWQYYLCYCEAGFRQRYLGDLQIIFNKSQCRAPVLLPTFDHE